MLIISTVIKVNNQERNLLKRQKVTVTVFVFFLFPTEVRGETPHLVRLTPERAKAIRTETRCVFMWET